MSIKIPEHIKERKTINSKRPIDLSYFDTVGELTDYLIDLPYDAAICYEYEYGGTYSEYYVEWGVVESDVDYAKRIEKYKKYMTTKLQNTK